MAFDQNYTLGRGKLYFAPFLEGTQTPDPKYRYIGNTPEFNLTIESENLDHYSSDEGIREKDMSVPLEVNRTGTLTTDSIQLENVAMFFYGQTETIVEATEVTVTGEEVSAVEKLGYYQLGVSSTRPIGARGLVPVTPAAGGNPAVNITVTDTESVPTTFVEGRDYEIDMETGMLHILDGDDSTIANGTDLEVTFKIGTSTSTQVTSGATPVAGQLKYVAYNPVGEQIDYLFPWVSITPNGDYSLKTDEWQQIPFTIEILKKGNMAALYANGRPKITI